MPNINLKHLLFIFCTLLIFCPIKTACCQEKIPSPNPVSINDETVDKNEKQKDKTDSNMWRKIWGKKSRDALLLGMWSVHINGSGEYFKDGGSNEQNYLLGIQYYGLAVGTFFNSQDDRAWFFGPAREVYSREITENTCLDIGYKFGPLYGYDDNLPNIGGISFAAAVTFGISWKKIGIDIMIIPVGIITGGFRINFD
jgi:hypothetical protein